MMALILFLFLWEVDGIDWYMSHFFINLDKT